MKDNGLLDNPPDPQASYDNALLPCAGLWAAPHAAPLVVPIDAPPADRDDGPVHQTTTLGAEFAHALAAKDMTRLLDLMHPEIDFRGLTPNRNWEASDRNAVISILLSQWFEEADEIEALERVETDTVADRERVGYRFSVSNPDGRFLVEQQAYLSARDGRIGWMRVVCSGYRPVTPRPGPATAS